MRFPMIVFVMLAVLVAVPAQAEDKDTGWSSVAEFGLVVTAGNAESETISFKDETVRSWEKSKVTLKLGGIRAETTKTSRTAVGTPGSFVINETDTSDLNAEYYFIEGRYDREIHKRLFWFAGAGWDQNRPSGIDSRVTAFGGVGNIWRDNDKVKFRTDYALSFTDREDVDPTPGADDSFMGLRASWAYRHQFTESTKYINDFIVDYGLNESDNWRAEMTNAVAVSINDKLALKVSLQWLYNNLPPVKMLELENPVGTPSGLFVSYELDELDTVASAALVVNF